MTSAVAITSDTWMQFAHSFGFEYGYDGGVVEYSTNNGATWLDAGIFIVGGATYDGTITISGAPRSAFTGDSFGYTASQLNLSSLAGQSVMFRFYVKTDPFVSDEGWFIDDIRIYRCPRPTSLVATSTSSTSVDVTWAAVAGATGYRVYRDDGTGYVFRGSPATNSWTDPAPANKAYLYKVRSFFSSESGDSNIDLATTIPFTTSTIAAGSSTVKAVDFMEMREAINLVRTLAGIVPFPFTDPTLSSSVTVKKRHIDEMRTALDAARSRLGLSPLIYTDTITARSTTIKANDINELRNGVQ